MKTISKYFLATAFLSLTINAHAALKDVIVKAAPEKIKIPNPTMVCGHGSTNFFIIKDAFNNESKVIADKLKHHEKLDGTSCILGGDILLIYKTAELLGKSCPTNEVAHDTAKHDDKQNCLATSISLNLLDADGTAHLLFNGSIPDYSPLS